MSLDDSSFFFLQHFLFLSRFFFFDDESDDDFFDEDSEDDGYGSGLSRTCPVTFSKNSVGRVDGSNSVRRVSEIFFVGLVSG